MKNLLAFFDEVITIFWANGINSRGQRLVIFAHIAKTAMKYSGAGYSEWDK